MIQKKATITDWNIIYHVLEYVGTTVSFFVDASSLKSGYNDETWVIIFLKKNPKNI